MTPALADLKRRRLSLVAMPSSSEEAQEWDLAELAPLRCIQLNQKQRYFLWLQAARRMRHRQSPPSSRGNGKPPLNPQRVATAFSAAATGGAHKKDNNKGELKMGNNSARGKYIKFHSNAEMPPPPPPTSTWANANANAEQQFPIIASTSFSSVCPPPTNFPFPLFSPLLRSRLIQQQQNSNSSPSLCDEEELKLWIRQRSRPKRRRQNNREEGQGQSQHRSSFTAGTFNDEVSNGRIYFGLASTKICKYSRKIHVFFGYSNFAKIWQIVFSAQKQTNQCRPHFWTLN